MTTYNYTRTRLSSGYDVPNIERVDGESKQIHLATEIETALSGKAFKVICNDTSMDIIFDTELSAGDKTTLDGVVSDHQSNA